MTVTISKWGNSQGLRFPKDIMKDLHLKSIDYKVRKVKFVAKVTDEVLDKVLGIVESVVF